MALRVGRPRLTMRFLDFREFDSLFARLCPKGEFHCAVCGEVGRKENIRAVNERTDEIVCDLRNCFARYSQGQGLE